jgi:hypothetical protein
MESRVPHEDIWKQLQKKRKEYSDFDSKSKSEGFKIY